MSPGLLTQQDAAERSHLSSLPKPGALPQRELPLVRPEPPQLSLHLQELSAIEASGVFSNYGPVNTSFEEELVDRIFKQGKCLTVCNATIGLMLAIREVIGEDRTSERQYALMPSFTFAAAAHAALWCGLTPLLCDIDPDTWLPDPKKEELLLERYKGQVAVIVPYATFGNNLDLSRYREISTRYDVPVVVDAAGSLGSLDRHGKAFGSGFEWPVLFSMHATKAFSVGEGGIIYCADAERMERLRCAGSFGFGHPRTATSFGLNSKLSEVSALTARLQLQAFDDVIAQRETLSTMYAKTFDGEFRTQQRCGKRQIRSFESILLPRALAGCRPAFVERLRSRGVHAGTYFSPHLAEHPYFRTRIASSRLPVTNDVAARVLSLPLLTSMSSQDVRFIVGAVREVAEELTSAVACA